MDPMTLFTLSGGTGGGGGSSLDFNMSATSGDAYSGGGVIGGMFQKTVQPDYSNLILLAIAAAVVVVLVKK